MSVVAREIRGRLLAALHAASPARLSLARLYAVVRDDHLAALVRDIEREMAYLVDKGYAEKFGPDYWSITAAGVDLVTGVAEADPGVIFEMGG